MVAFVIRRLLQSVPVVLAASFFVFVLVANSGDPLEAMRMNPRVTAEQIEERERELNLDDPVLARYARWLGGVLQGDLGQDLSGNDVSPQLWRALKVTLRLVLFAVAVAVVVAIVVGVLSAIRQYSVFDYLTTTMSFVFFALPTFWLGVLLKEFGAIRFNDLLEDLGFSRWVATIGESTPNFEGNFGSRLLDSFGHLVLPALTLILVSLAQYSRFTRASMLDVMSSDYVRTARAKGISNRRVVVRHGLRNALIPLATVVALDFAAVIGSAVIVEQVFQWRGMGTLFIEAVRRSDVYVMQGALLVTAVTVVIANLVADIVYAYLDPRIRLD